MRFVAFLRNVNQGQHGQPTTDDIRGAFEDAGCRDIRTFQSNGTVLFDSDDPASVVQVAEVAVAVRSGHAREIFWIPLARLTEIVAIADARRSAGERDTAHRGGHRRPGVLARPADGHPPHRPLRPVNLLGSPLSPSPGTPR